MKKLLISFQAILIFSISPLAQQPNSTPPKNDDSVVKISTNLIQIDVTVTDKNGKVVTGLGSEDFEIRENGELQKISNLTFVSKMVGEVKIGGGGQSSQNPSMTGLAPGQVRRTIAIVVDDLNLSFGSVYYTRKTLRKFVDEQMQPNDLVAIIRTGGSVGALQQFTSDKLLLLAAIEKIRWNPWGNGGFDQLTSVGQNDIDVTERFAGESDAMAAKAAGSDPVRKSILTRENVSDKKATDYNVTRNVADSESGVSAQAGLGTIRYVIGGMNDLPGRKVMMLFSDGITISEGSNKSRSNFVYDLLPDLVDFANRSSVVVYTFDTRGLQSMAIQASDSTYEVIDGHRQQKVKERLSDFKASQDGLVFLAHQTGGKSLLDSNDLNSGIERALDEQSGYYLIGYVPDAETFDPAKRRFNKLEVRLINRPGLAVSYRSGFFNTNPKSESATALAVENKIAQALMSPFARSEIALNMNALYADDPNDGTYIRSFLHIDAKNLTFAEDAEGWKKAKFDVVAVSFGDNGVAVDTKASDYTIKAKGPTYDAILKNGFVYVLIMPIKTPGVYQYRVAVRDASSGKIGTASQVIEIPNLAKQKLAISSLAVENVTVSTWQNMAQGKIGANPGQIHVASTLLYDTVLKQFPAGTVLRYGFEVYNAKLDGKALPRIETQARIMQNDRAVVEGNAIKFDAGSQQDLKHAKVSGAIMLKDSLTTGDYVLQIIVIDMLSRKRSVQLFPFVIVK